MKEFIKEIELNEYIDTKTGFEKLCAALGRTIASVGNSKARIRYKLQNLGDKLKMKAWIQDDSDEK